MTGFEYALGLFSVLIGLALVDVAVSAHKLIRHFATIRWDARVILSVFLVILVIVRMWFAIWSIRGVGMVLYFPFYLSLFVELLILFLLAANCLPDDPTSGYDLTAFYERNQRTLWTLFAVFQTSFFFHWLYFVSGAPLRVWAIVLCPLAAYVLLILIRDRAWHIVVSAALIGSEIYLGWSLSLT